MVPVPGPQLPVPQVITAQQLPKLNRDKGSSIVDPFVRVEIHGIPADCAKQQTHHKLNNGECWHLGTPGDTPGDTPGHLDPWGRSRAP